MRNILFILSLLFLSTITVLGQNQKFVSAKANLEFSYPSSFSQEKINNAPHMLLKLMGKNDMIALSYWDYGMDESLDAWDDDYYQRIKSRISLSSAEIVSLEKVTITINNKSIRAVEFIGNETTNYQGKSLKSYNVTYQIWYKGNLIQVLYSVFGKHYKPGSDKGRSLLKGLKLK